MAIDPGGIFASDAHRRVLGHLPVPGNDPTELVSLYERMMPDVASDLDEEEISEILEDLEADGHVSQSQQGWRMTKKGLEALQR